MDWNAFKELLQSKGKEAVSAALGNSPLGDIINNAPDLFNQAATSPVGQAVANGVTGAPITDSVPNPGNPVSGMAEGLIAPGAEDASTAPQTPIQPPVTPLASTPPTPDASVPESSESDQTDEPSDSSASSAKSGKLSDNAIANILSTPNNDNEKRKENDAALERRKKLNIIPEALANVADAVAGTGTAFGANISQQAGAQQTERDNADIAAQKGKFEEDLKNDPNSDLSKQYQGLLAKFIQKDPSDPMVTGRSAAQIASQIPAIEKLATIQNQKDMKELGLKQIQANKEVSLGLRNDQQQAKLEKEARDLKTKVLSNRSGGLGLQDAKVNQAIDLQQMISKYYDPKTDTYTIPPSLHTELAIGLQRLLSPSGQTSQHLVDELRQKTAREGLAGALIYMGADPRNVGGTTNSVSHLFADAIKRQGLTAETLRNKYQSQLDQMYPTQLAPETRKQLAKESLGNNFTDYLPKGGPHSSEPAAPVTKSIGGKTYIQKNGKWYQQ